MFLNICSYLKKKSARNCYYRFIYLFYFLLSCVGLFLLLGPRPFTFFLGPFCRSETALLKAQAQGPNLACRTYEAQSQTQLNWPTSPQPYHPYAPGYFLLLVQSLRPRSVGLFLLPAHPVAPACRLYLPCISPCPKPSPSMHSRYLQVGHPLASSTGDQTIEPKGPCCLAQAPTQETVYMVEKPPPMQEECFREALSPKQSPN